MQENESQKIPSEVQSMIDSPGIYLGHDEKAPHLVVPIFSANGRLFSMKIDSELNPYRFIPGTKFSGPLNPT
jgi:hypothetical protein